MLRRYCPPYHVAPSLKVQIGSHFRWQAIRPQPADQINTVVAFITTQKHPLFQAHPQLFWQPSIIHTA